MINIPTEGVSTLRRASFFEARLIATQIEVRVPVEQGSRYWVVDCLASAGRACDGKFRDVVDAW